ncbi:hypothetical protein COCVIDRAFT_31683 [Bipolaris victoriae FI3]|uniref:Uncharacterized protein n=1 Tax=Bipolaris victoriae (strain FI3) TaxID=930091 RepID=W7EAH3_BIPV3|nr:hypothetical protein COCVIDRAFT_31683 [Bipolaris victoriae FI3]
MMNTKVIALCLMFHIAGSLGGPVNAAPESSITNVIEDSAKQVAASEGPIDASKKDGMFIQYIWKHPSFQYNI